MGGRRVGVWLATSTNKLLSFWGRSVRGTNSMHLPTTDSTFLSSLQLNYRDCEKAVRKHHIDGQRFLVSAGQFDTSRPKLFHMLTNHGGANWSTLFLGMLRVKAGLQNLHTTLCHLLRFCMALADIISQDPIIQDTSLVFQGAF